MLAQPIGFDECLAGVLLGKPYEDASGEGARGETDSVLSLIYWAMHLGRAGEMIWVLNIPIDPGHVSIMWDMGD